MGMPGRFLYGYFEYPDDWTEWTCRICNKKTYQKDYKLPLITLIRSHNYYHELKGEKSLDQLAYEAQLYNMGYG